MHYRTFRNFSPLDKFRNDLANTLANSTPEDYNSFSSIFEFILDAHAPKKKRTVRGNHKPHMIKTLRKAIMLCSSLKNKAKKTGNIYFSDLYRKQRNYRCTLKPLNKKIQLSETWNLSRFLEIGYSPLHHSFTCTRKHYFA